MSPKQDFSSTDSRVQIFAIDSQTFKSAANTITELIDNSINQYQTANVIIASGNAILQTLGCLSAIINWQKVNWFLADERCVAANDPQSNRLQITRVLEKSLGEKYGTVIAPDTRITPEKAVADYASRIASISMFNFCLLGMGNDGHIASLLPQHSALSSNESCCLVTDSPNPPSERITMTLKTFARVSSRVLITVGAAKNDAIRKYIADPQTPVRLFNPTIIFSDRAAYQ